MWTYQNKPITAIKQLPEYDKLMGFIYLITNKITGQIYIGRKNFYSTHKQALAKKDLVRKLDGSINKGRKQHKHVTKESDWLKYWSSCDELKADVKTFGEHNFSREILELSCGSKFLTYSELKYQIQYDVLNQLSYNGNIAGTIYRKDMEPCKMMAA